MRKLRFAHVNRLGVKLTLCAMLSVGVALTVFFAAQACASAILETVVGTEAFQEKRNAQIAADVQRYVSENGISLAQTDRLWDMPGASTSFILMLYADGELVGQFNEGSLPITQEDAKMLYPIAFADGEGQVYLWEYGYYAAYYRITDSACGALAFLAFAALFVRLIRKKLRYILLLERELAMLESGDLYYPITIQGSDELGSLARGIDDMRRSFIERQEGEAEAIRANQSLVTAMSHDLRTPLTSLLGYLELLQNGQYASAEQLRHFVSASRDKAYRIKEMTDALFEYALCSGPETPATLQSMDGYELFSQLLTEHGFELESAGFRTELHIEAFRARARVDPGRMARVFENLASNIKKYADPGYPVQMEMYQDRVWLCVRIQNKANADSAAESNRIGLKTCARILQQHNGKFEVQNADGMFTVTMALPIWDEA